MVTNGEKYLVTSDSWFFGPDGHQYRAAWGKCKVVKIDEVFGFTPQRPSTNWVMQIGEGENQVIIAGCQIHQLVKCDKKPIKRIGKFKNSDGTMIPNNVVLFCEK